MSTSKKRTYNSDSRRLQAVENRKRILSKAKELFIKIGFESVKIDQIAEEAAVSPSSIYGLFKSKRGIIAAIIDEALPSEQFESMVQSVKEEPTAEGRLAIAAKMSRKIYDAEKALMDILRGASALAPELKKLEQEREERRYERQKETIKELYDKKLLTKDLSLKKARDLLWTFTGRDLYRLLVIERGWSSSEYEKWLKQQLILNLLD